MSSSETVRVGKIGSFSAREFVRAFTRDVGKAAYLIVAFTVFLLVLLWGAVAYELDHDRTAVLDAARTNVANLTRAYAEHVTGALRPLDQMLLRIKTEYERNSDGSVLAQQLRLDPAIEAGAVLAGIADESGTITTTSAPISPEARSIGNRGESFQVHAKNDFGQLYISLPLVGRYSGKQVIVLSRRLNNPNGTFAGIVFVSFDPQYLSGFFNDLVIAKYSSFAVVGRDMIVRDMILGTGPASVWIGKSVANSQLVSEMAHAATGDYETVSVLDHVVRLFSYRALPDYPLIVLAGIGDADVLGGYYERRAWLIGAAAALTLFFVAIALFQLRRLAVQARAEQALRQTQELLVASQHAARLGYVLHDVPAKRHYWSDSLFELRGVPPRDSFTLEEAIQSTASEDRERYLAARNAAIAERRSSEIDIRVRRPDGTLYWEHRVVHPYFNARGDLIRTLVVIQDITNRKENELKLARSEERFRALIEHSTDMVTVVKTDLSVTYRSPSSTEVLGVPAVDVVGRSLIERVHDDDRAELVEALRTIAETPGRRATGRSRVRHRDGSWRHIAWSARNATDIPGVDGIILNSRDVTETLKLEGRLYQAQKMEAIGQIAGGIAHDFNNILGVILGYAEFLIQDLPKNGSAHGYAERILTSGGRARDLVQQILAFSHGASVERKPLDLVRLVRDTKDMVSASLPRSARLEIVSTSEPLIANVNVAQITQILLNLCVNASHALSGEPGTISLAVSRVRPNEADHVSLQGELRPSEDSAITENRIVVGTLDSQRDYALITVADTGTGMEPSVLTHIFDPFFTTKERGSGTGLGLYVVHSIVLAYKGACVVTSTPGSGSVFAIYLPLEEGTIPTAELNPSETSLRGRERILVVDDEAMMTDTVATGLRRLGYEVVGINNPDEALRLFTAEPDAWDAVITDVVMPAMNGVTLLQRLKTARPSIRVILCTGFSESGTEERALAEGADAFLHKPVSPMRLSACLRQLFDQPVTTPVA